MLESQTSLGQRLTAVLRQSLDLVSAVEQAVVDYFKKSPTRARVWEVLVAIDRHRALGTASAMAFDLFLAIVPMLGLAGYLIARFFHSQPLAIVEGSRLLELAPARLHEFIAHNLTAFAETDLAPFFLLSALWLSSSAFVTMVRVFEESFDCEPRNWLVVRALALGFAALGLSLVVTATVAGAVAAWQGLDSEEHREQIVALLGLPPQVLEGLSPLGVLAFVGSSLGIAAYLAFIYRFSIVRSGRRRYIPGALVATAIGLVVSFLFAYYATHLARYALFYGGLAAIVIVLLWLWVWCTAILIGAEVNGALEGAGTCGRGSKDAAVAQGSGAEPTQTPSALGKPEGDWQS